MDNISLVTTALEYYDLNSEKYDGLLKHARYLKFIDVKSDMENNVVCFYDKNKTEIFRSRYEIIGLHNPSSNTWTWAWAIPFFRKNNTNIARKLWNYGAMLDPDVRYLKSELITSRFRVADSIQLDIHVGIASYISKNPFVYKYGIGSIVTGDDGNITINTAEQDSDGLIPMDQTAKHVLVYYMFLLDHTRIQTNQDQSDPCIPTENTD
jgi:hypothetical protein